MKILVTGGAGYIGSILCEKLLEQGYEVVVLDRLFFGDESLVKIRDNPRFKLIVGDIQDREIVRRAMYGVDAVIHLAAIVGDPACAANVKLAASVNFNATVTVAELAKKQGIEKFIFASTCSVYGANQEIVDEESELNPLSLYAQTRLYGEWGIAALTEDNFRPVILRFGTVYGLSPRMRFDLVVNFLTKKLFTEGQISIFGGGQWRPLCHVADISSAIMLVLAADFDLVGGEIFNVGTNEHNYQLKDLVPIYQRLNPKVQVEVVKELADKRSYRVNFDKVKQLLNFTSSYSVETGIQEIYDSLVTGQLVGLENFKYSNHKVIENLNEGVALGKNTDTKRRGSEHKTSFGKILTTMHDHTIGVLRIEEDLRQALERQEFRLHYQPILDLGTNGIIGFEALLRWQHPQQGLVFPAGFIPVAEETGLIVPIGWWVLRQACQQMRAWQKQFPTAAAMVVSVNLSSRQLSQPDLVKQIEQILQETGLDACSLRLEITESMAMENSESFTTTLLQLKALGVQLQIDNFGTGYSSSSLPSHFPNFLYGKFDRLKVDRSIIQRLDSEENLEILEIVVTVAQDLGMDVTAAGVEKLGQIAHVSALEFNHAQGHFFSKPVEHEAAEELIGAQPRRSRQPFSLHDNTIMTLAASPKSGSTASAE